jgi:tetratricopeptide (TPR) repeat protein
MNSITQKITVKDIFLFLLTRTFVFYLLIFVFLHFVFDFNKMQRKYNIATLNRIRPESLYLIELSENPHVKIDKHKISEYRRYLEQVEKIYPGRSDTYGMLGFCYYYLKNYSKADFYFQKAAHDSPAYIFLYNQALINIKQQKYSQAITALTRALSIKPEVSMEYISRSIVYRQILAAGATLSGKDLAYKIKDKMGEMCLLLGFSYYQTHDYPKALYFLQQLEQQPQGKYKDISQWLINSIMVKTQKYPQAIVSAKNILESNPRFIKVYDNLIESLEAVGQQTTAVNIRQVRNNIKDPYDPLNEFLEGLHAQIY